MSVNFKKEQILYLQNELSSILNWIKESECAEDQAEEKKRIEKLLKNLITYIENP